MAFHLLLGLPNDLFPSGFETKIQYAFLISPLRAQRYESDLRVWIKVTLWC